MEVRLFELGDSLFEFFADLEHARVVRLTKARDDNWCAELRPDEACARIQPLVSRFEDRIEIG